MTTAVPQFNTGGDAAQEYEDALSAAAKSGFQRAQYLSDLKKPGDTVILRIILDSPDWKRIQQHALVPTKPAYPGFEGTKWPELMSATCRKDPAIASLYEDCAIDVLQIKNKWNNVCKPTQRIWSLACVREEVTEGGVLKGYRDAQIEVPVFKDGKDTGEKKMIRKIVILNYSMKNFFGALQGLYGAYGTVTDRDYLFKQVGEGKDVDYQPIGLDPIRTAKGLLCAAHINPRTGEKIPEHPDWHRYTDAIEEWGIDLNAIIFDRSTDDYFHKFFDSRVVYVPPKKDGEKGSSVTATDVDVSVAETSGDVPQDRLAAMRDRVRDHPGAAGAAAPAPAPTAASSDDIDVPVAAATSGAADLG